MCFNCRAENFCDSCLIMILSSYQLVPPCTIKATDTGLHEMLLLSVASFLCIGKTTVVFIRNCFSCHVTSENSILS